MSKTPARLDKKTETSLLDFIEVWALRYAHILLPLAIIILILLIVTIIGVMVVHGGANITMVESGTYYNHFKDVI